MTKASEAKQFSQVSQGYRHYDKTIHGHGVLEPASSRLKWYYIARGKQPIKLEIRDMAGEFLARQTELIGVPAAQELGFVLLHRCGGGFYFLGLCTWRGNNELWKTQFYFDEGKAEMTDFALFTKDGQHKDTFCVWELAVVSHETEAWANYLRSGRTEQDADTYLTTVL